MFFRLQGLFSQMRETSSLEEDDSITYKTSVRWALVSSNVRMDFPKVYSEKNYRLFKNKYLFLYMYHCNSIQFFADTFDRDTCRTWEWSIRYNLGVVLAQEVWHLFLYPHYFVSQDSGVDILLLHHFLGFNSLHLQGEGRFESIFFPPSNWKFS